MIFVTTAVRCFVAYRCYLSV